MANHADNYIIITTNLPPKLFFINSDKEWEDEDTGDDSNWSFRVYDPKVFPEITDWWTQWFDSSDVTITRGDDGRNTYTISGTSAWTPPCEGFQHIYDKLVEYDPDIEITMYFDEPGCELFWKWYNGEATYLDNPRLCYSEILNADIIADHISDESAEVFEQFYSYEDSIEQSKALAMLRDKLVEKWADTDAINEEIEMINS